MPTRYAPGQTFDPEVAKAMSEAFTAAWDQLTRHASYEDGNADWARETLALRIIDAANAGEHDVDRLRDDALAHLANLRIQKRA